MADSPEKIRVAAQKGVVAPSPAQLRGPLRDRVRQALQQMESTIILETLEQNRWNRRRTAEALQISYRSLMYKMKRCNLREGTPGDGNTGGREDFGGD